MVGLIKLAVLVGVFWLLYQKLLRDISSATGQPNPGGPPLLSNANRMQKCSYCGVHIPEGESTQSRGHFFCCEAHRNAFFAKEQ